jgi:uncharacterized membrane protein YfcA
VISALLAAAVGLGAGLLSGAFGVGGGVVTTPAIRMILGYPELVAVGTPLPVIIPTAIAGAIMHARLGTADMRTGMLLGMWGAPSAIAGASADPAGRRSGRPARHLRSDHHRGDRHDSRRHVLPQKEATAACR